MVFFDWLSWHFIEVPREILRAWKNILKFSLNYFSIGLLLKTFFAPWKKIEVSYGKGLDFGRYFEALASNIIFRSLGMIMRSAIIASGLIVEVLLILLGIGIFFLWLASPAILLWGIVWGLKIML